jgi:hypothetical protein
VIQPYSASGSGRLYRLFRMASRPSTARRMSVRLTSSFGCRLARAVRIVPLEATPALEEAP